MSKEMFKYLFAVKNGRSFCVKFDLDWEQTCVNYLIDLNYKLSPASEQHWNRGIDEDGSSIARYLLDKDLKTFDVGTF